MKHRAKRAKVGNKNKTDYSVIQGAVVGMVLFVLSLFVHRWVSFDLFFALALPLVVIWGFATTYREDFTPKTFRIMLVVIVVLHVPLIVAIRVYSLVLANRHWMVVVAADIVVVVLLTVIFGNQGILQSLVAQVRAASGANLGSPKGE